MDTLYAQYKALACAIVLLALRDAEKDEHRLSTTLFFRSDWCKFLVESVGIDYQAVSEKSQELLGNWSMKRLTN